MSDWVTQLSESPAVAEDNSSRDKRIDQLRQRLDQYNAAIAEMMGPAAGGETAAEQATHDESSTEHTDGGEEPVLHPPTLSAAASPEQAPDASPSVAVDETSASGFGVVDVPEVHSEEEPRKLFSPSRADFQQYGGHEEQRRVEQNEEVRAEDVGQPVPSEGSKEGMSDEPSAAVEPSPSPPRQRLSMDQLENARFTIELLNETIASIADRHSEVRRAKTESRAEQLARVTGQTQGMLQRCIDMQQTDVGALAAPATYLVEDSDGSVARLQSSMQTFFEQRDSLGVHFEPIYAVQRRHAELGKKIQQLTDQLQHRRRQLEVQRRQVRETEEGLAARERILRKDVGEVARLTAEFDKDTPHFEKRLQAVEKREERIAQWMRILETRDQENGEKERLLRLELDRILSRESELQAEKENVRRRADFLKDMGKEEKEKTSAKTFSRPSASSTGSKGAPPSSMPSPPRRQHESLLRDDDEDSDDDYVFEEQYDMDDESDSQDDSRPFHTFESSGKETIALD